MLREEKVSKASLKPGDDPQFDQWIQQTIKKINPKKSNHYCIMTFSPTLSYTRYKGEPNEEVRFVNQALMLFEKGNLIKDDQDMVNYCTWFCSGNGVKLDDIKLRVSFEEVYRLRLSSDDDIEWNYCGHDYFKYWKDSINT